MTLAGQKNANGEIFINDEIAYTDETLALIFNRKINTVRLALKTFEKFRMVEIDKDQTIIISNWGKHQSVDRMEKIRIQDAERAKRYRLNQRKRRIDASDDRQKTHQITLRDASRNDCVTVTPQNKIETKIENKRENLLSRDKEGIDECSPEFSEAKIWLSKLFGRSPLKWIRGRKRGWSDEEKSLLVGLLPISREDQELIQWGYSLSRDLEGFALIDGKRVTKPKQSLVALLRDFSSELDKWRSARMNANGAEDDLDRQGPASDGWTPARKQAAFEEFGEDVTFATPFHQLLVEYRRRIDERIEAEKKPAAGGGDVDAVVG